MRVPITLKITLFVIVAFCVLLVYLFFSLSHQTEQFLLEAKKRDVHATLISVGENLEFLWKEKNTYQIRKELALLAVNPDLESAIFVDNFKRVIASTDKTQIGKRLGLAVGETRHDEFKKALIRINSPLDIYVSATNNNADIYGVSLIPLKSDELVSSLKDSHGALFIHLNLRNLKSDIYSQVVTEFYPGLPLLIFIAIALTMFLHHFITRRIAGIESSLQNFLSGEEVVDLRVSGRDEIADLASSLSLLMENVVRQHGDIVTKEKDMSAIIDAIDEGVIGIDGNRRVLRINRKASEMTGWLKGDAVGEPIDKVFDVLSEKTQRKITMPDLGQVRNFKSYRIENAVVVSRGGDEYDISYSVFPIDESTGKAEGAVIVFQNISVAKQAQRTLDELSKDITNKYGQAFFEQLALNLNRLFNVKYVSIGELYGGVNSKIQTLALCENGKIKTNLAYAVRGSPCEETLKNGLCVFENSIQSRFPDDEWLRDNGVESYVGAPFYSSTGECLGLINLMDSAPLNDAQFVKETLSIFAIRVANEFERSLAFKKLQKTQAKLTQHINNTPVAVIEWDKRFKVVSWNPAAQRIFGYKAQEILGQGVESLVPFSNRDYVNRLWRGLEYGVGGERSKNENIDKYGNLLFCDWFNTRLTDENGEFIGVASLVMDISRERKALKQVTEKEHEQREILESMVDGVITIDGQGVVLSFNSAAESLFGYKKEEVIDKKVNMLMTQEDMINHDAYLSNYYETGKSTVIGDGREVIGKRKDGTVFPFRLAVSELPLSTNGERRFIGCCQDLTIQKQQEEQLRRTQKMESLGKLTGGVAHDFNNILGIVSGYAELLRNHLDDPKLHKYADEICRASDRGEHITSRMLAFSRRKEEQTATVNINALLQREEDFIKKSILPTIELDLQLQQDLWLTRFDASDFLDAVLNLVINAGHAISDNGKIVIRTSNCKLDATSEPFMHLPNDDYVLVEVIDNGKGIEEKHLQKIFDPFFTTKNEKGSGLGLSQVYGFVKRSQGDISVKSAIGQGTCIKMMFPKAEGGEAKQVVNTGRSEQALHGNETILVVDDEPSLRHLLEDMLTDKGYRVICTSNAVSALAILANESVDLVFSDVVMPDMNGYQMAELIKRDYPSVKIQLASGYDSDRQKVSEENKALKESLLSKPYHSDEVLTRIRQLLDQ